MINSGIDTIWLGGDHVLVSTHCATSADENLRSDIFGHQESAH